MTDTYLQIQTQEDIEGKYSRKHIDAKILTIFNASPYIEDKINEGVKLVQSYMMGKYHSSKMNRIAQLAPMNIRELVTDIFVGIVYCTKPELFTSVTAKIAARLDFGDKAAAITTVAELLAVLCITDVFDISKENAMASLTVTPRIKLSTRLVNFINNSQYLPPMVCTPLELTHNYCSGYLTHNDSLVLGKGNHHHGDLCLDVLNTMNNVALQLDTQFLSVVEEEPTFELDTRDRVDEWNTFKLQSYRFYSMMVKAGNKLYLTHKVDKRGRVYAQGYHINTQGTAFKKASLELHKEELVTGI